MGRFAAVAVLVASSLAIAGCPERKSCTADARVDADGRTYGRDPTRDCKFVDEDGNLMPGQE